MLDALYTNRLTGEGLHEFAVRANALLERSEMVYPVDCKLFGSAGEKLAAWVLTENNEGATECAHSTVEERWMRSVGGVSLTMKDATGQVAEMALIVGPPRRLGS